MPRSDGPFDYYDELHPGSGADVIAESTDGPEQAALRLLSLAADLRVDQRSIPGQASVAISGPLIGAIEPGRQTTAALARNSFVFVGVTRTFAGEVEQFDHDTERANDEFRRRWGVANAIRHDPDYRSGDWQGPEPDTWADCYAAGNKIYKDALDCLDTAMATYTSGLADPDQVAVKQFFLDGLLPLQALVLFPRITLTRSQAITALGNIKAPPLGTPIEVLQAQLDLSRLLGLHPRDYKELLRTYWQSKALERAGIRIEDWDLSRGAQDLEPIITAVYDYYGDLYKENPRLEWAGLANLVGPSFAAGFLDLGMMRDLLNDIDGKLPPGIPLGPFSTDDLKTLANMGEDEVRWWETQFLGMQKQIFLDMGAMNQAYVDGGMPAIEEMAAAGLFDKPSNPTATQDMLESWRIIDDPDSTPQELHDAAKLQAYREQHDIIQDDYQEMYDRDTTGPVVTKLFSTFGEVSVPEAQTMGEVDPSSVSFTVRVDPVPFLPGPHENVTTTVTMPIPQGNVANFDDRWTYFTEDTLPAYVTLLDDPDSTGTTMDEEMADDMSDRIDEYRILNRMDSIRDSFLEHTTIDVDGDYKWW